MFVEKHIWEEPSWQEDSDKTCFPISYIHDVVSDALRVVCFSGIYTLDNSMLLNILKLMHMCENNFQCHT